MGFKGITHSSCSFKVKFLSIERKKPGPGFYKVFRLKITLFQTIIFEGLKYTSGLRDT